MKHLLIGLFALAAVLGTGCTKDEAVKPSASVNKKADGSKPAGGDCACGLCPCGITPPK